MTGKKKKKKLTAGLEYELDALRAGCRAVVGLDEAGRGAWAGPVYAGAVSLPAPTAELTDLLEGVRDSKQVTPLQRALLVDKIKTVAVSWGVGYATNEEIDILRINDATRLAMRRALSALMRRVPGFSPDYLLLDSIKWEDAPVCCPQAHIKKGDQLSLSIAAASILAKVARDETMHEIDAEFPGYGFAQHKGYGTPRHLEALRSRGACAIHRHTFRPVLALADL